MAEFKDFPYTSIFETPVCFGGSFDSAPFYSQASLEGLRGLIPSSEVNIERNFDLLAFAANACGVGIVNKNDDVISPETAVSIFELYKSKAVNKEHKRDKVVGHLVSAALSDFETSEIITPEDAIASKRPFNISVGGVVYKVVDKEISQLVEESADPENKNYGKLSLSMEKGFANYGLMIGSKSYFDAEIINNPKHVEELKKYLKAYGGTGETKSGEKIYRLIGTECLPMGVGLVRNPAGVMKTGVITKDSPNQASEKRIFGGFFNFPDKIKKTSVTPINPEINMELETILKEVKASLAEISASKLKEEAKANLVADISDKLLKANEEYVAKTNEAKAAKEKAEAELTALKATQEAQATELAATKQKLADLEAKANAEAAANLFSARMDEMNNEFDLDDEDRAVLASEIKNLDEKPESFAAWKDKMGKLMKDKNKKAKEMKEKEAKAAVEQAVAAKLKELSTASANQNLTEAELAKKALEEATAKEKQEIPNNNSAQSELENLRSKWKAALSKDSVTITQ